MVVQCCNVQRSVRSLVSGLNVSTSLGQQLDHTQVAGNTGQVEGRQRTSGSMILVGAVVQEKLDCLSVALRSKKLPVVNDIKASESCMGQKLSLNTGGEMFKISIATNYNETRTSIAKSNRKLAVSE